VKTRICFWFLLAAVLLPQLWAQSSPTLLATTDLDCTWKLDGKVQGALKADDATVISLSLGKHLVQATSTDGLDQWRAVVTVTQAGQEMVEIKLKDAHQKRIVETQPAVQPTPPPAQPPAAQPVPEPAQPIAEPVTPPTPQPETEQAKTGPTFKPAAQPTALQPTQPATPPNEDLTWTDPATRLMWTATDNGKNVTWEKANSYCGALKLADYSNWRLPTINELAGIYDESQNVNGFHVKGGIRVTGWEWSSEAQGDAGHRLFTFHNVKNETLRVAYSRRALCVRASGE
jgi:outer membrane biosynthesis protein TonB